MKKQYSSFGHFVEEVKAARQPLCMVIFGPPGSGKGTNARKLVEALGLLHVETGAMIRGEIKSGSDLGKKVRLFADAGRLVPDKVILEMVEKRLSTGNLGKGVIFDGFPRTVSQARQLDGILKRHGIKVNLVLSLAVPDSVVKQRLRDRAVKENRPDDAEPGVIEKRIKVYHKETVPILGYYSKRKLVVRVNAEASIPKVYRKVRRRVSLSTVKRTAKAGWQVFKKRKGK